MNKPIEIPQIKTIEEVMTDLRVHNFKLRAIVFVQSFALFVMTALILFLLSLRPGVQQALK